MRSWGVAVLILGLLCVGACAPADADRGRAGPAGSGSAVGDDEILISEAQVRPTKPAPGDDTGGGVSDDPTAAACARNGGEMIPACLDQQPMCIYPYSDAGQPCDDGDDCQGDCRAVRDAGMGERVEGRCQANSYPCGCATNVEDGRSEGSLCVD